MNFTDIKDRIITLAVKQQQLNPSLRYGQCIFNIAYDLYPSEVDEIRGDTGKNGKDPFYNDDNVEAFFEHLRKSINK